MYICEFEFKDDLQNIILQDLRQCGIKHRQKKYANKQEKSVLKRVFKVPLNLLPTENIILSNGYQIKIPSFVFQACNLLKEHLETEGLFRKAGSNIRQKEIKILLDKNGNLSDNHHVIDIANVLKLFFRELPEPLIPFSYHDTLLHCLRLEKTCAIKSILATCLLMPSEHLYTLMYLMEFLQNVASYSDVNKMDISNLSIILTPSIMPLDNHLKMSSQSNQRLTHHVRVVHILIENASSIGIVPPDVISKLPGSCTQSQEYLDMGDEDRKKKKKRRSGSLTRMFNGLRKMVSGKIVDGIEPSDHGSFSSPDLLTNTPCVGKSSTKRKAPEITGLSSKKKREVLHFLPHNNVLPTTPFKPINIDETPKREPSKNEETTKRSYLMLSGRRNKSKRSSFGETEESNGALKRLERRWSAVSNATTWGKKKKQSTIEELPLGAIDNNQSSTDNYDEVFLPTTDVALIEPCSVVVVDDQQLTIPNNEDTEFVRIPKQEYEEIKSRVSAIENRLSKEFDNIPNIQSIHTVDDVQIKYEQTLEEAGSFSNTSTDQLAKRLSRELKIRRNDQSKVIRSPSARKIGTIRRRSKEFDRKQNNTSRLERNQSWHIDMKNRPELLTKSQLRRGRPNTIYTGLPHPSPSKLIAEQPLTSTLGTPTHNNSPSHSISQKLQRSISFNCQSEISTNESVPFESNSSDLLTNSGWKPAETFFAQKKPLTPDSQNNSVASRASLAKLRSQNAGMVLAKAKLFDELLDTSKNSSTSSQNSTAHLQPFSRNNNNRVRNNNRKVSPNKQHSTATPKRKQKSPGNVNRKHKLKLLQNDVKENVKFNKSLSRNNSQENTSNIYENINAVKRIPSLSPLKDSNRINPNLSPKNTPRIKKTLGNKSPRAVRQTALSLSEKRGRTPLKGIHGLQSSNGGTPRRCSPRLLLKTRNLSSAC